MPSTENVGGFEELKPADEGKVKTDEGKTYSDSKLQIAIPFVFLEFYVEKINIMKIAEFLSLNVCLYTLMVRISCSESKFFSVRAAYPIVEIELIFSYLIFSYL